MSFFDTIYKQLFEKKKLPQINGKKYILQETYSLSNAEEKKFKDWKNEKSSKNKLKEIYSNLNDEFQNPNPTNQRFSTFRSPQSNGFYILCEDFISNNESVFILESLKDSLSELGYYVNHSSRDIYEEKGNVNTKLEYYLKPKLKNHRLPMDQRFGNIHLELFQMNGNSDYIKLMANIYSDRNYQKALDFEDLINALNR